MLTLAAITLLLLSRATGNVQKIIDSLNINYEKQVLKTTVENPSDFSIDYDKNNLFYCYSEYDGEKTVLKIAYLNLDSLTSVEVTGVEDPITSAIDNKNHRVYIGGKDGIYNFDYDTKKVIKLDIDAKNIWHVVYKDGLYFTTYTPDEQAFYAKYFDKIQKLTDDNNPRIRILGIDYDNTIYFANSTGLFYMQKSTGKATLLVEDIVINAFNADKIGELYFSTPSSLYHIKTKSKSIEKLAEFHDNVMWGFAIDGNGNIIYGSEDNSIVKLIPALPKQS